MPPFNIIRFHNLTTVPELTEQFSFVGTRNNGDGTFSDFKAEPSQVASYIAAIMDGRVRAFCFKIGNPPSPANKPYDAVFNNGDEIQHPLLIGVDVSVMAGNQNQPEEAGILVHDSVNGILEMPVGDVNIFGLAFAKSSTSFLFQDPSLVNWVVIDSTMVVPSSSKYVKADASAGPITLSLPTYSGSYTISKIDNTGNLVKVFGRILSYVNGNQVISNGYVDLDMPNESCTLSYDSILDCYIQI